jgi:hypothetical protein
MGEKVIEYEIRRLQMLEDSLYNAECDVPVSEALGDEFPRLKTMEKRLGFDRAFIAKLIERKRKELAGVH